MKRNKYDFLGRAFDWLVEKLGAWLDRNAPEGWEDEKGFHYRKEKRD